MTPASAAYSPAELEHQLRTSAAKALFTCASLLDNALKAARAAAIPDDRVFLLPLPGDDAHRRLPYASVDDLVDEGRALPALAPLNWPKGQGARQTAYLCYSSGTSGLPVSQAEPPPSSPRPRAKPTPLLTPPPARRRPS